MILFIFKYLWIMILIVIYVLGWFAAIKSYILENTPKKLDEFGRIYPPYDPLPFYEIWCALHCIALGAIIIYLFLSSFYYWQTGQLFF